MLGPNVADYQPSSPDFRFLFNSYYEAVGARQPRPARGLLTRPSADDVAAYRREVDDAMAAWLLEPSEALAQLVTLGLQHEQQHQELLLTDMLHGFAQSPLLPAADPGWSEPPATAGPTRFMSIPGGIANRRATTGRGVLLRQRDAAPRRAAERRASSRTALVRNGEWLAFMEDGGYRRPTLWMADGWDGRAGGGMGGPAALARDGRRLAQMTPRRPAPTRPGRAGAPRQLVRGGCLRPLGRAHGCRPRSSLEHAADSAGLPS